MYIKYLDGVKSDLIESANSSQLYITNERLECWYGYLEKDTAVIITNAEYDYDTKTYLLTLRDLYHNTDKIRLLAKDAEFKKAFRQCPEIDKMYKEYRDKVNEYYNENVQTYDFITTLIILIVALLVSDFIGLMAESIGMLVLNSLTLEVMWLVFGTLMILLLCTIAYKGYVRYIAKKGNWSRMMEEEQQMREKLASDVEKHIKSLEDESTEGVEGNVEK